MAAQLVRSESAGLSPVGSNVRGVPKVVRWAVWGTCSSYRTDCRRSRLTGPSWTSTSSTYGLWCGRHNMPPPPASGDLNSYPERPGDLDLWPLELGSDAECQLWHGQPSRQFCCFCTRHFVVEFYRQTRVKLTTWRYNLDLWPLRHRACRWCGSSYSIRFPTLKFVDLPVPKTWLIFGHGVKPPGDLDLWPFDL